MKTVQDYIDAINSVKGCMVELDIIKEEFYNDYGTGKAEIIAQAIGFLNSYIDVLKRSRVKKV